MKLNIKKRLKNKTFLISSGVLIVNFIYELLKLFDIIPKAPETEIINILEMGLNILAFFGVVNDPTTKGFWDSDIAMNNSTEEKECKTTN